jgi:phosphoglycolate phosphatase
MKKSRKLVLFDIDGTLIGTTKTGVNHWKKLVQKTFATVYKPLPDFESSQANGKLERLYFREFADMVGVPPKEFEKKFPEAISIFYELFKQMIDDRIIEFHRIQAAYDLVMMLQGSYAISMGLLTGNNEPLAWYKLRAVDFDKPFTFGAFGTEVEHRGELVSLAIVRAAKYFSHPFSATDTIIVGDTKYDIAAAKHVGAIALGVSTGHTDTNEDLQKAGADLAVDSLMDERVLSLLGLK